MTSISYSARWCPKDPVISVCQNTLSFFLPAYMTGTQQHGYMYNNSYRNKLWHTPSCDNLNQNFNSESLEVHPLKQTSSYTENRPCEAKLDVDHAQQISSQSIKTVGVVHSIQNFWHQPTKPTNIMETSASPSKLCLWAYKIEGFKICCLTMFQSF